VFLKFEVLFFTFRKSRKHHFTQRTRGLAETVANFTSEICLLAKNFFLKVPKKSFVMKQSFLDISVENFEERCHLEDLGVARRWEGVDWIRVMQTSDGFL
jgi:hypothetical protein